MATNTSEFRASRLAGRYSLGEVISRGGMGEVHRGRDHRLHRDVAIKVLSGDRNASPAARQRFEQEARAAARVSHPNVVAVYDIDEHDGDLFLVMELLPGRTLADEIREGPLAPTRVRELALALLAALQAAHDLGVLHRDIKPANILFAADGTAKLADFGIAKLADASDLTDTGQIMGTAAYLAPERLRGQPASPQADLYSLAVVLFEALTGRRPFGGTNPVDVVHAATNTPAPKLRVEHPEWDEALTASIDRGLRKDPGNRFASAADMARAILDLPTLAVDPVGTHAVRSDALATVPMTATQLLTAPTQALPRPGWRQRRRVIVVALVAWLLLGALALAVLRSRDGLPVDTTDTTPMPTSTVVTTVPTTLAPSTVPPTTEPTTVPPPEPSSAPSPPPKGKGKGKKD